MNRFGDIDWSSQRLPPVYGYYVEKLVSIEKALEPIQSEIDELPRFIKVAKRFCHFPSEHGLSRDQSAAIYIYTMEWGDMSLYRVLNKALRSEDRQALKIWFPYLKLFETALDKLPTVKQNVWRGVPLDIGKNFTKNQIITWWSVNSCSSSVNIIKKFLANSENPTLFLIEAVNGKKVSGYTEYEREDEVILRMGTQFCVKSDPLNHPNSSHVVHLIEIDEINDEETVTLNMNATLPPTTTSDEAIYQNLLRPTNMHKEYAYVPSPHNYDWIAFLALENRKLANQLKLNYAPMEYVYKKLPNSHYRTAIYRPNDKVKGKPPKQTYMSTKYHHTRFPGDYNYKWPVSREYDSERKQSITSSDSDEVEDEGSYVTLPNKSKKPMILFSQIYILKNSLYYYDLGNCEVGDEFEFICHNPDNSEMLCLKHLRTSVILNIHHSSVELDENTPLRLGKQDQGVIECFLLKSDARYSFLIHRSDQDENVYILSVTQHHKSKEAPISHYFIYINKENNCFYLAHEEQLRHCFFPTFQQLVNDARVHQFITLSKPVDRSLTMNDDELWEIDYKHLIVGNTIGVGEFAEVLSGKWKRNGLFERIDVAIKILKLKKGTSKRFDEEFSIMKRLRNQHLVSLFGISIDPITNEKLMVYEFMDNGDLKSWLRKQFKLPSDDILLNYCHQICLGMSYLERNHCVHRDLACRNILLRGNQAKIADFGMAVVVEDDPYYPVSKSKHLLKKLPYRWTAPEIFAGQSCTTQSDVWAFGICLVEIWSKGGLPYPSIKHFNEVREKIQAGYIHKKPQQCSEMYYKIIQRCLMTDPESRPSFEKLADQFKMLLVNKNEWNVNIHVKTHKSIVSEYNMEEEKEDEEEEEEALPVLNLRTSRSSQTDDTNEKQNNLATEEGQDRCIDAMSTESNFSPHVLYDISECTESDEEIPQPKNHGDCRPYAPFKTTDTMGSYTTQDNRKLGRTKFISNDTKTTNYTYRKIDKQEKTDEPNGSYTFI